MNAKSVLGNSYVPYSGEPDACMIESKTGACYPGVRIENISFPLTVSALQSGLFTCLSEGEEPRKAYLVHTGTKEAAFWKEEYDLDIYPFSEWENASFAGIVAESPPDIFKSLQTQLQYAVTHNSNFPVSALLKTGKGFVSGVNIECSEWNLGLCAERVAIAKALSYGITDLQELHVYVRDAEFSSPCGACRQVILEHLPLHTVYLYHPDGSTSQHYTVDLLPYSFQSSRLRSGKKY